MTILPVGFQLLQSHNVSDLQEKEAQKQNSLWHLRGEYLVVLTYSHLP